MSKRFQTLALLGAGVILLTGVLLLSRVSPYRPGLAAAPGYALRNPTEPGGFVAGYVKELQALLEVTPCTYEILGWRQTARFTTELFVTGSYRCGAPTQTNRATRGWSIVCQLSCSMNGCPKVLC